MASSRTTADVPAIAPKDRAMEATSCSRRARRPLPIMGASAATFIMAVLLFLGRPAMGAFEFGEPIAVLVSAGDDLTLTFEGDTVDAVAVSFQQCSGSEYMSMEITYDNDYTLRDGTLTRNTCHRIVGAGTSFDDSALDYDNLCAFKSSGIVGLGYDEESTTLSGAFTDSNSTTNGTSNATSVSYLSVDPGLVYVKLINEGTIAASAELVMFSTTVSSTNAGAAIDRVQTESEQDDNTFTVTTEFQASGTDQSFCSSEGCAVYAYYLNMDEIEDSIFGTSCQAREGIKVYEGYTTGDELDDTTATAVVQSTTAFEIEACVELPKETEATYRVYVIVSPDTSTYARVGYGLQDQLIYASDDITVEDDMDKSCPESTEVESTSGAATRNITPMKVSTMMAVTLAAAVTLAGF